MADLVATYLTRLDRRLSRRLPKAVAEEHVLEIGGHLRENVKVRVASGDSEQGAEIAALKDLGSDLLVADGLIRAHSGIASMSVWRLSRVPVAIYFLTFVFSLIIQRMSHMPPAVSAILMWLQTVCLTAFCIASWRSRRILILPMIAVLGIVSVMAIINMRVFNPKSSPGASLVTQRELKLQLQKEIDTDRLEIGLASGNLDSAAYPKQFVEPHGFLAPTVHTVSFRTATAYLPFVRRTIERQDFRLIVAHSEAEARQRWKKLNGESIDALESKVQSAQLSLDMHSGKLTRSDYLDLGFRIGGSILTWLALLMFANLASLALGSAYRRLVAAAWQPQRLAPRHRSFMLSR